MALGNVLPPSVMRQSDISLPPARCASDLAIDVSPIFTPPAPRSANVHRVTRLAVHPSARCRPYVPSGPNVQRSNVQERAPTAWTAAGTPLAAWLKPLRALSAPGQS